MPEQLSQIFLTIKDDYTQTCSKAEQLTLALFMARGLYQINIKKLRTLYAQKLQKLLAAIDKYGKNLVFPVNTASGINITVTTVSYTHLDVYKRQALRRARSVNRGTMMLPALL